MSYPPHSLDTYIENKVYNPHCYSVVEAKIKELTAKYLIKLQLLENISLKGLYEH